MGVGERSLRPGQVNARLWIPGAGRSSSQLDSQTHGTGSRGCHPLYKTASMLAYLRRSMRRSLLTSSVILVAGMSNQDLPLVSGAAA